VLHNAGEEALCGLLGAEQHQVDILVPAKQQAFGQDSNPHHSLQGSRHSHNMRNGERKTTINTLAFWEVKYINIQNEVKRPVNSPVIYILPTY